MSEPRQASADAPQWAIEVRGLTKAYGNRLALRGIDLKVKWGEHLSVFGPNGAGKTTLVKVLSTLTRASSGKVWVAGLELREGASEIRRHIGVVSHETYLYPNLTAYENLRFYARMYDVPSPEERIEAVSVRLGINARLHDRVGTLSRGMQQRLSITRALLHKPAILFLDEPETGLDQQARTILDEVLGDSSEGRATILMTTHNLERGLVLGDRVIIMAQGKVVYEEERAALDLPTLQGTYYRHTGVGM